MKLSNYVPELSDSFMMRASVDVTTGFIFKKTVRRQICKEPGLFWFFADTGEYTPCFQAENLASAYMANKCNNLGCKPD